MLRRAFTPLANATGHPAWAEFATTLADNIVQATQRAFWSAGERIFVNNLPWRQEEGESRLCDRSLATALLFGLCPNNDTAAALETLATCPATMGLSYPANAGWRYWALAEGNRTDVIIQDFRNRWATMDSVRLNNTIGENWAPLPDSTDIWSHCAIVPLYITIMSIAGIRPAAPGFVRCTITPRPADIERLGVTARTVRGEIVLQSKGKKGDRELRLQVPPGIDAVVRLDMRETVTLRQVETDKDTGIGSYALPAGKETTLKLEYT
jgi:alpha-L-rhamnosidase